MHKYNEGLLLVRLKSQREEKNREDKAESSKSRTSRELIKAWDFHGTESN